IKAQIGIGRSRRWLQKARRPITKKETAPMPETAQLTLPVLPLHNGVVFPHMVVTIRVETEEGKTALAAARSDGRLLLVPRLDGRYSTVGTIAEIQSDDDGSVVVSGMARARVGAGSVDDSGA